jgi:hypothetical protein
VINDLLDLRSWALEITVQKATVTSPAFRMNEVREIAIAITDAHSHRTSN